MAGWERAGVAASVVLVLFFAYGHAYNTLKAIDLFGTPFGRHRYLLPLSLVILIAALIWIRRSSSLASAARLLNCTGAVLLLIPLARLASYELQAMRPRVNPAPLEGGPTNLQTVARPDIYYIILDAYTREDVLERNFDFDNQGFVRELGDLGFYVAGCSQSNYGQTDLSLASSLNLDYLQNLNGEFIASNDDRSGVFRMIRDSAVRRTLEGMGYEIVAFETGFPWTELDDAGTFLGPKHDTSLLSSNVNAFEGLLIRTTALSAPIDASVALFSRLPAGPLEQHESRVLYTLDQLGEMATVAGPKFVFAHVLAPHKPYIFGPLIDSELSADPYPDPIADPEAYAKGYVSQVMFVNERVLEIVRDLKERSEPAPIIVLQGDHGPDQSELGTRMAILNALHLPDADRRQLYPEMTPVNTFRLILREYFGFDLEPVEDVSYYSGYEVPYDFTVISNPCTPG
jgi:hypothetical protein